MKVIDEKGKMFGKINLIDLLVILVLVLIVAAVGWKLFGSQISQAVDGINGQPKMQFEVLCTRIEPNTAEYAVTQIGTQLMASGDMLNGYITDCKIEPYYETMVDAEGNAVQVADLSLRNVRFTCEANVVTAANAISLGSQELRVGKAHIVKTVLLEINGFITNMKELTANG